MIPDPPSGPVWQGFGMADADLVVVGAGLAGLVAGSLSMAGGEYVSVSSQRDTELAALDRQRRDAAADPVAMRRR